MNKLDPAKLNYLESSLESIQYGSVVITIHDGAITQIDAIEKKRFAKSKPQVQQNRT